MPESEQDRQSTAQRQAAGITNLTKEIALRGKDWEMVLPATLRPETFVRLSQGVLRKDPELAQVALQNRGSFFAALLEAARLGHEPGTKRFALARFGPEIVGIETYQGAITRLKRDAGVVVHADLVRKNDHFRWDASTMDRPEHTYDPFATNADRGPVIGGYAYGVYVDGRVSQIVFMNMEAINKRRKVARTQKFWAAWEEEMELKTVINRLENFIGDSPSDAALARLAHARESAASLGARLPSDVDGEVVDGEVVE